METKIKKLLFQVDLIEFDLKNVPHFLIFSHNRDWLGSRIASGTLRASFWYYLVQNKQNETFLWKPRIRNLSFTLTWLSSTSKTYPIFWFSPIPAITVQNCFWGNGDSYWHYLTPNIHYETFHVKTKNKKPIFHVDLIEFDTKNVPRFLIFSHSGQKNRKNSGVLGGSYG